MPLNFINVTKIFFKANDRGLTRNTWLNSRHSFSFADYFDGSRVNFGTLCALNDDIIRAGTGFGNHPHDNMEIISIPINGALKHTDSMGHEQIISTNEVQVMSARTGIFHSEKNASNTEDANFLQLWIFPNIKNVRPVYNQKYFDPTDARNCWQKLVTDIDFKNEELLNIHQNALISRSILDKDFELKYKLRQTSFGCFLFIVSGAIEIDGEYYTDRDAIGLTNLSEFTIKAIKDSYVLNIEVTTYILN